LPVSTSHENLTMHAPGRLTVNLYITGILIAALCGVVSASDVGVFFTRERFYHILVIITVISLVAVVLLVAALCTICCAGAYVGKVAKGVIMRIDRDAIGVDVTIGNLVVAAHTGKVEVFDVMLLNPEPYSSEYLLKAGHVKVDIDMCQFLRTGMRHLTIQSLVLQDVDTIWEKMGFTQSNIKAILDFVEAKQEEKVQQRQQQQQSQQQLQPQQRRSSCVRGARDLAVTAATVELIPTRTLTIREVVVKDVGVKLASHMLGGAGVRLALGDVAIRDVSAVRTHDIAEDIAHVVLNSVLKTIVENVAGKSLGEEMF